MTYFNRVIGDYILPSGVSRYLKSLKRKEPQSVLAPSDILISAKTNAKFKDKHKGERCFILATGPSIKTQDLSLLQHETCIGVSQFFFHEQIDTIRPEYHVLAPFHAPFKFDACRKIFEGLKHAYSWPVDCFLGYFPYEYSTYDFLQANNELTPQNTHYINYTGADQLDEKNVNSPLRWDICQIPFSARTVVYSAVQVATYMGFQEIYLLGCDHDYLKDIKRVENHHFYAEEKGISDKENLSAFDQERWFYEYYMRWMQYRLMKQHCNSLGIEIFNATPATMLDVFPRVDLATALEEKKVIGK